MTGSIMRDILQEMAAARSRQSWNDRFQHWERPASNNETTIIDRAAAQVRGALSENAWINAENVEVRAQGSYHNNTNVRQESDMDLAVWHPAIHLVTGPGLARTAAQRALRYTDAPGDDVPQIISRLRCETAAALSNRFGRRNIKTGTKAVTVHGLPGARADADAVPVVRLTYAIATTGSLLFPSEIRYFEGVCIVCDNGTEILNFPEQHYNNGVAKRARTQHRFKKVVRTLKAMRDELVELSALRAGQMPSFLIECLVYRVEDEHFLFDEDRFGRIDRVLKRIQILLGNMLFMASALEINDIKPLFDQAYPWYQPWTAADARGFVAAALTRLRA